MGLIRVGEQELTGENQTEVDVFGLINIFRYDYQGRIAEEWVQTDNRSRLRQLGAKGR